MADFSFRLKAEVATEEAVRRLTGFTGSVEQLENQIADLIDTTGKSTNELRLNIVTTEKGKGTIARVTRETVSLDKAQQDRERTLNKLTSAEQGSLLSLRQTLNTERQLKNALLPGTAAYAARTAEIIRLEAAVRRASGIQDGSVNAIRAEGRALQEQLTNQNLSIAQRNKLTQAINANAEAERRAQGIQSGSISELRAQQAEQQRLADTLRAGTAEQVKAQQAALRLGNQISALTPKTTTFIGALNKLATIQAGFQAITAIFGQVSGSIDKIVKRRKEVEAFNLALQNVGLSAADSAKSFNQAAQTANNLGAPVQQVEKAYKRITPALRDIGASAEDTDKFIANLTARTQVLGLTTEESGRLQEAFAQVLSKGKLQAEELTQQIAEVDGAFRTQFAQALGITSAELSEFASQGVITSSVFVKGVNNMNNGVDLLRSNIESGNATIQQLQNLINNISVKTLEKIGVAIEPGIRAFLQAGKVFADFVQQVASSSVGKLLGDVFNQVAGAAKNFITALAGLLSLLIAIVAPIADLLRLFSPLVGIFVVFVATVKTASLALAAFNAISLATKGAAAASAGSINFAASSVTKFGAAIKALLSLKVKEFFTTLSGSILDLGRALIGGDISRLTTALKGISGTAVGAGQTLSGLVQNVNNVSTAAGAASGFISPLSGNIANAGKVATQFSTTSANAATALAGLTPAAAGVTPVLGTLSTQLGLTTAASTGAAAGATALAGGATTASPALVGMGGAAATAGAGAAAGAVGFYALLAPLLPFIAVAAGVLAAIAAITTTFNNFGTAGRLAGSAMGQLRGDLDQLGTKTEETGRGWQGFVDQLLNSVPVVDLLYNAWKKLQDGLRDAGFKRQAEEFRAIVQQVDADFKQAGLGGLTDFRNAANLSGKEASNLIGKLNALASSQDKVAAAIRNELDERKAKGQIGLIEEKQLEREIEAAEDKSAAFQILSRQLAAATVEQRKAILAEQDNITAVQASKKALEERNAIIDSASQKAATAALNEYNDGLITQAEYEQQTAAVNLAASKEKLAAIDKEMNVLSQTQATRLKDANEYQQVSQELAGKRIEAEAAVAEAQKAYREAELARIQEITAAAEELVGVYKDGASIASTSFDNFSSGLTGAVDQLRDSIAQEAAIEFSITGDETILNKVIDTQGKALEFEYKIGRTKNQINQAQRQFELELQAIKIQTLKLEAQQKGGPNAAKLVAAYDKQLGLIQQISNLNQVTAKAENLQLDYKIRSQQRAYNLARETAGLEPWQVIDDRNLDQTFSDFDNFTREADAALSQFGPIIESGFDDGLSAAKAGFQELQEEPKKLTAEQEKFNKALQDGIEDLSKAAKELASKNYGLNLGKELQKALGGAFDAFNKSLASTPKVVNEVKDSTVGVQNAFSGSADAAKGLNNELVNTNRLLREAASIGGSLPGVGGAVPARAMGGPVLGGSSYLVNDGGGREAFVDMSGRASLLPASRNIKWRAPSDGFILPAPMTNSLIQNSKINAKITSANNATRPHQSMNSSTSGLMNSGNLIKQMGAMMSGGNTQRITNHVTIQSQSPVMDASKIMANVTKLRARRGIRQ